MNGFQILGLGLLGVFVAITVAAATRQRIGRGSAVAWIALWVAAGAAIADPDLTMVVAHLLGIARGADLVFYCAILAMLAGFFAIFARLRRVERDLTRMVRHLAVRDASPERDEGREGR